MKRLTACASTSHDAHARAIPASQKSSGKSARSIIAYLTGSCALMMTGFGIATPIFARRLSELGAGVEVLSMMAMASALAQFLLAPWMGAFADRFGRRPIVLFALSGLAITNLAFLVARSSEVFIVLRFLQGAFSVGMLPAAMGMIADLVPERNRTRWVAMLMSGYALGLTIGPVMGGLLFAWWGDLTPFGGAFLLDLLALFVALVRVPETREAAIRHVQQQATEREPTRQRERAASFPFPRPHAFFAALLLLDVIAAFGMAFIEPQMVFYLYKSLSWTTTQYGLMMSGYAVATLVGQVALGQLGDHLAKKPIIALGFLLSSALPLGLTVFRQFSLLAPFALLAGLGSACISPALGASYLDITASQHRSVIQGIRESAVSFSAVAGPLLAAFFSRWLAPQGIFTVAAVTTLAAVIPALVVLKLHGQAKAVAVAGASLETGRQIAATISATPSVAGVAQAVHATTSRPIATMGEIARALLASRHRDVFVR